MQIAPTIFPSGQAGGRDCDIKAPSWCWGWEWWDGNRWKENKNKTFACWCGRQNSVCNSCWSSSFWFWIGIEKVKFKSLTYFSSFNIGWYKFKYVFYFGDSWIYITWRLNDLPCAWCWSVSYSLRSTIVFHSTPCTLTKEVLFPRK